MNAPWKMFEAMNSPNNILDDIHSPKKIVEPINFYKNIFKDINTPKNNSIVNDLEKFKNSLDETFQKLVVDVQEVSNIKERLNIIIRSQKRLVH